MLKGGRSLTLVASISSVLLECVSSRSDGKIGRNTDEERNTKAIRTKEAPLRRRMTPVGRLALVSETAAQPSISAAVIRVDGPVLSKEELGSKLDVVFCGASYRFKSLVDTERCEFIEMNTYNAIENIRVKNEDLTEIEVGRRITEPFENDKPFWDCTLYNHEGRSTVLLRAHHCLADGVSLASLFGEATDQAQEIRDFVDAEIAKRRAKKRRHRSRLSFLKSLAQKLTHFLVSVLQFGVIFFSLLRAILFSSRPLKHRTRHLSGRSIAWASDLATVDELKAVAKDLGISLNDLFATAVARGLATCDPAFIGCNLVAAAFPIHLYNGVRIPGLRVGNHIGAVILPLPLGTLSSSELSSSSSNNLDEMLEDPAIHARRVSHDVGATLRGGLAAILSYALANILGILPRAVLPAAMHASASCATIACTNIRGPPIDNFSLCGRPVLDIVCIMPPPPGVAIGAALSTLKGHATISINTDASILPAHALLDSIVSSLRDISSSAVLEQDKSTGFNYIKGGAHSGLIAPATSNSPPSLLPVGG